jgi:hypothetical protein
MLYLKSTKIIYAAALALALKYLCTVSQFSVNNLIHTGSFALKASNIERSKKKKKAVPSSAC